MHDFIAAAASLCIVGSSACDKKARPPKTDDAVALTSAKASDAAPTQSPKPKAASKRVDLAEYYVLATIEVPSGTEIEHDMLGTDRDFARIYVKGLVEANSIASAREFEIEVHPDTHCPNIDEWLADLRNPKSHGASKLVDEIQNELTDEGLLSLNEFVDRNGKTFFEVRRCHARHSCDARTYTRAHADQARAICATLTVSE